MIGSYQGELCARLMIQSLRSFGGSLSESPVWILLRNRYKPELSEFHGRSGDLGEVHLTPLVTEEPYKNYFLVDKVFACAQAEEVLHDEDFTLTWISPDSLVIKPPLLFDLNDDIRASFRPVHIRNIGSLLTDPVDCYWKKIYEIIGVNEISFSVESFVDQEEIRPYFNTHAFSIDPSLWICQRWLEFFKELVSDSRFQAENCSDELHKIFLHQAVLSALVTKELGSSRIRVLPADYSYPLHLNEEVQINHRPRFLNDLTHLVYEEVSPHPVHLKNIEVLEPLRSWLIARVPSDLGSS